MRHPKVSRRRTSSPLSRVPCWVGAAFTGSLHGKPTNYLYNPSPIRRAFPIPGKWSVRSRGKVSMWRSCIPYPHSLDLHLPLASNCSGGEIVNATLLPYLTLLFVHSSHFPFSTCDRCYFRISCCTRRLRQLITCSHDPASQHQPGQPPPLHRDQTLQENVSLSQHRSHPELALVTVGLYQ